MGARANAPVSFHGALKLPEVRVDSHNLDIEYQGRRLAASTNKRALRLFFEKWRKIARGTGADPFGRRQSITFTKKELDAVLLSANGDARCVVHGAIEDFAGSLALLTERLLLGEWQQTECIAIGGGLRASNIGELIIRRTQALLIDRGLRVELCPIRSDPDDAALLGAAHLVPSWMIAGHDAIVAADIGGTNVRIGIVRLHLGRKSDLSKARVWKRILWRHANQNPGRDAMVGWIVKTMQKLIKKAASEGLQLAPYIGVACPGFMSPDGSIGTGSYVLPGDWQSPRFNLPSKLTGEIPRIGGHETLVLLHNDAVVQGLSEIPFMRHCRRWGVFTIGTGFGNARFSNPRAIYDLGGLDRNCCRSRSCGYHAQPHQDP